MTTTVTDKLTAKQENKKSAHKIAREQQKAVLKVLIIKNNLSIAQAAFKLDMEECTATGILFAKRPTQKQIDYALEVYNKGLSLTIACVAAGVSFPVFRKALREARANENRIQRW